MNNTELDSKIAELKEWFQANPKLPQEIHPLVLKRFLKCMNTDVEETKKLIEINYTMRNKNANMYIERDPEDAKIQATLAATDIVPLPGLTPERYKVLFYRLTDLDAGKTSTMDECRIFYMLADCRFTMPDVECEKHNDVDYSDEAKDIEHKSLANMAEGDIQIIDISTYSMAHIAHLSISAMRTTLKFLQEAYPVRLRAMHMINCPSYLGKMIAIVKPFVRDDVYKMIHFHKNLESLYEFVPREMLPEEYGGTAGKIADMKVEWTKLLHKKRDYLMDSKYWKVEQAEPQKRWTWF